jgi:hypothetical protein
VYLAAGVAYNKGVKKATGKELLPNYGFWTNVPGLIKVIFICFLFKMNHSVVVVVLSLAFVSWCQRLGKMFRFFLRSVVPNIISNMPITSDNVQSPKDICPAFGGVLCDL